jgi:hypothetical protein
MNTRKQMVVAAALTLGMAMLFSAGAKAQPLDDRVLVNMPYTTIIGHKTLSPGDYVIQRMPSAGGGGRVLLIYSDNGMKFETSAITIPCQDRNIARDTKVVLSRVGNDYYYDKVWVQGKEYGYEFVLPKEARMRRKELMAQVTVPASTSTSTSTITTTTAIAEQPAVTTEEQTRVETESQVAEVVPPPAPEVETAPEVSPAPPEESFSADREMDQNPPPAPAPEERTRMPKTASDWLGMLSGSGALLGLGLYLRRKR